MSVQKTVAVLHQVTNAATGAHVRLRPADCVRVCHMPIEPASKFHTTLVRMLAAPVNPADINAIEGVYPVRGPVVQGSPATSLCVGGFEGAGVLEHVGPGACDAFNDPLEIGDTVLPMFATTAAAQRKDDQNAGFGTWRRKVYADPRSLVKLGAAGASIPAENAARISVNPCTAYRLLSDDFVSLKKNDIVVQNAATSAVGRAVIQLARRRGIKTVNLARQRANFHLVEKDLKALGADFVVPDQTGSTTNTDESAKVTRRALREAVAEAGAGKNAPVLALNCIGGRSASELLGVLSEGGVMVTYGAMARVPFLVGAAPLIFKNIAIRGFWLTQWRQQMSTSKIEEAKKMISEITNMVKHGELVFPEPEIIKLPSDSDTRAISLLAAQEKIQRAFAQASGSSPGGSARKLIFDFRD